jgi:hypothetical protein
MQKAHDALVALRTMAKTHPALQGREYIDLGVQTNNAIEGLEAAIKAAQPEPMSDEQLARRFHEIYERLAPQFGYVTRQNTRKFDPTSANGRLMMATCRALLAAPKEAK